MASELKVYNQFREVILHILLTTGDAPKLHTINATEEMRSAVSSLIGQDFDRTVGNGDKLKRFTAIWGTPEYARVLAEYFLNNFGWSTSLVEREQSSSETAVDAMKAPKSAMAAAAGVGANRLGYAGENRTTMEQIGSGHVFDPVLAGFTSQQSELGEL